MKLSNRRTKYLRRAAHHLRPVAWASQHGVSEGLVKEIEQTLETHALIEVKPRFGEREDSRRSQIKGFLRSFRGIATTYLDSYLRWSHLIALGQPSSRACLKAEMAKPFPRFTN